MMMFEQQSRHLCSILLCYTREIFEEMMQSGVNPGSHPTLDRALDRALGFSLVPSSNFINLIEPIQHIE